MVSGTPVAVPPKKSLGDWLAVAWHSIVGFITGAVFPIVVDRLQGAVSAGVPLTPNGIEVTLLSAVIGGVLGGIYKTIDTSNNALVKSTLENNITPANLDSYTTTLVQKVMAAQAAQAKPASNGPAKAGLFLLAFLLAGSVNANPIAIPNDNITTPAVGSDHLILLPLTNFNASVATPANYGLGFEYGIAYANLLPVDPTHINVQPYLCLGVFASANVGDWIKGDGPISVDYGITIGTRVDPTLPMIGVSYVWNTIARGDALEEINASIDTTLLNDILGSVVKIIN